MIVEILTVLMIVFAVVFFWPFDDKEPRYTYVEEKDENGNIVEKVIEHSEKDK